MATTFEELLGRSTRSQSSERYDSFPSFDEFTNRNKFSANNAPKSPYANETATPYDNRFQDADALRYDFAQESQPVNYNIYGMTQEQVANYQAQSAFVPTQRFVAPTQVRPVEEKKNDFYQYAISDMDISVAAPSYEKQLGYTHSSRVEDGVEVKERLSVFTPVKSDYKKKTSKRAKINTKGKILFAVFFAIVVLVTSLIVVNAGDLNRGTATTPSSSVSGVVR